jgi:DNA invertase Pin-like site-specific DNA recombinase
MKAALYARVSTEDQAKEGFSLDAQLERLRSFCNARGWEIAGEYVDDGYSGRDDNRPAYRRMMEERDRWDTILVMRMDRIHRNSRNFMEMMERLRSWGKEFTSMQESLDTGTAMGRFVMDIIQRIAQLESEQIAERVYTGMRQKASSGQGSLGFPAPFGYRYENGRLVVNREEAEIVREIFYRYTQGEPMAWIAEDLNARGVTTSRGGRWTVWSVRYLLQNPVYAGYLRWDGILQRGEHEPIVETESFLRALRTFHSRARSSQKVLETVQRSLRTEGAEAA